MTEIEQKVVGIISAAGESKAKAFEALKLVREKKYEEAKKLLKEAREIDMEAHEIQTELIRAEMSEEGDNLQMSLLMVHAQDHYMTSQLARDLIEELILIFENREEK